MRTPASDRSDEHHIAAPAVLSTLSGCWTEWTAGEATRRSTD
jgi:hypothetical protein